MPALLSLSDILTEIMGIFKMEYKGLNLCVYPLVNKDGSITAKFRDLAMLLHYGGEGIEFYGYSELNGEALPSGFKHYKVYIKFFHGGKYRYAKMDNTSLSYCTSRMNGYKLKVIESCDIHDHVQMALREVQEYYTLDRSGRNLETKPINIFNFKEPTKKGASNGE